jgi:transcriptional regulator with XRE-family HTH domain
MTFGEHIRTWREERGVGLRQFAKAVGVSPTFVSKMERGLNQSTGDSYTRLHRYGDITRLHGLPSVPMSCGSI